MNMNNIIGVRFIHPDSYNSKKTYYFRNNTGFPFKKGDKVIVLNYHGQEEVVEVHIPSVDNHPRIPSSQMKAIVDSYPPRNFPARASLRSNALPNI